LEGVAARWLSAGVLAAAVALGACSSSPKGEFTAPDGVNQSPWDEYCRHSTELIGSLDDHAGGTLEDREFVLALTRYRDGLAGDPTQIPDLGPKVTNIVEELERLRLMANHAHGHGHGDERADEHEEAQLDDSEVRAAVDALPECVKTP
jgi:hypothetical protein